MKDENAMQLDARVTDMLTKPSLTYSLAIQRLMISNRIMRSHPTRASLLPTTRAIVHYGRLVATEYFPPLNPKS